MTVSDWSTDPNSNTPAQGRAYVVNTDDVMREIKAGVRSELANAGVIRVTGTDSLVGALPAGDTRYVQGRRVVILPENDCDDAPTLNLSSIGALPITRADGSNLEEGDLQGGTVYPLIYERDAEIAEGGRWRLYGVMVGDDAEVPEATADTAGIVRLNEFHDTTVAGHERDNHVITQAEFVGTPLRLVQVAQFPLPAVTNQLQSTGWTIPANGENLVIGSQLAGGPAGNNLMTSGLVLRACPASSAGDALATEGCIVITGNATTYIARTAANILLAGSGVSSGRVFTLTIWQLRI